MYPLPLRCNPNQFPEIVNPYLALALDLDTAVVSDLVLSAPEGSPTAFYTGDNLRDALRRLVRLLDRPESFAVLKENF